MNSRVPRRQAAAADLATMDGMDYDPMVMDGEPEQPQVTISAVWRPEFIAVR